MQCTLNIPSDVVKDERPVAYKYFIDIPDRQEDECYEYFVNPPRREAPIVNRCLVVPQEFCRPKGKN